MVHDYTIYVPQIDIWKNIRRVYNYHICTFSKSCSETCSDELHLKNFHHVLMVIQRQWDKIAHAAKR